MYKGTVKKDLIGKQFGCYTVLDDFKLVEDKDGQCHSEWLCECKCGNRRYIHRDTILNGKHDWCPVCKPVGVRNEKLYHIYYGILQRCYNPKNPKYQYYGGKGIKVCDEWLSGGYPVFKNWSYKHNYIPDSGLTIDRKDSDDDYSPENCRWISLSENSARANRGRVKNHSKLKNMYAISPTGEKIEIVNISQFCREHDLNKSGVNACLHGRLGPQYYGWTFHSNESREIVV